MEKNEHTEVYGICKNKCLVPVYSKEQLGNAILQNIFKTDFAEEYKGVASDYGADILKIEGKSEQITTTGANILNSDICNEYVEFNAKKGTYLTLMTNGVPSDGGNVKFVGTDDSEILFAIDKGTNRVYQAIQKDVKGFYNLLVPKDGLKYMLAVGDIKTYEPFTGGMPSPNPNYPQEIRNALDEPLVSVGRNLFDASKLPTETQGGATITNNGDGSFTISGSGNLTQEFTLNYGLKTPSEVRKLFKAGNLTLTNGSSKSVPYFEIAILANGKSIYLRDGTTEITDEMMNATDLRMDFNLYGASGSAIKGATFKPMLYQEGNGEWEPYKYAETKLNFQRMCSVPDGTCDTYENGISTQRIGLYGFNGGSRENWILEKCDIGNRFKIELPQLQNAVSSHIGQETSINSALPLGVSGATFNTKNCYTINNNTLYVSLNGTETLEEFKQYLSNNEMQLLYKLETPIVLEVEKPIVPTFYPYTNIFQSDNVKAKIQYGLRSYVDSVEDELKEHNHDDRYFTENEINTKLNSYKVKGDFAVINSNIILTNGDGQLDLAYPSGFNKDNCVCIAAGLAFQNAIGYIFNDYPYGSFEVRFKTDKITCLVGDNGQVTGPTGAKPIRIVLMKV